MAIWIVKAGLQKAISFLPYSNKINYFFQRNITRGLHLTNDLFESKLVHLNQHLDAIKFDNELPAQFVSFEIGTGWYPIVPVGMFLCGAAEIYTADIVPLLDNSRVDLVCKKYIEYHNNGNLKEILPALKSERVELLKKILGSSFSTKLQALNMKIILGDLKNYDLKTKISIIHSNNTFEHIYPSDLTELLRYCSEISTRDTRMSHFIDMSDHFSHLDKKITPYNFLKFSERQWKLIDNNIQPQNRLRINEYRQLFDVSGWDISKETEYTEYKGDLKNLKLNDKFKGFNYKDILATHVLFHLKLK